MKYSLEATERLSLDITSQIKRYIREKYAHFLLLLFYPFTDEKQLDINESCVSKLNEENVWEIINQNKQTFEQNSDLIDNYVHQIHQERNTY